MEKCDFSDSEVLAPCKLVQQRIHLKRDINARSSPILRLPPEICSEIFVSYLSDNAWLGDGRAYPFRSPVISGRCL
jgi:hypothetical protein